jgi:nitrate/nitrite-specific signal transduction histidine kinase
MKEMNPVADLETYLLSRYAQLEEQNAALATLYVACQSLHTSLKRADVLLSVREIVANLIGCEEYALFVIASEDELRLVDSFGINSSNYEQIGWAMRQIENVRRTGECYWSEDGELTACIPLRQHGVITGFLALFRLLPQKFELHETDRELLRLLESQLASALYCSELHEKQTISNEVAS